MAASPSAQPLQQQILLRVVPVLLMLLAILSFWAVQRVNQTLHREIHGRVEAIAVNVAGQADAKLRLVIEACQAIANNDVVINGIVDQEYRNAVTRPFIRSIRLPGSREQQVMLADYRGRYVAGSNKAANFEQAAWLPSVMQGNTATTISDEILTVATPAMYAGNPEAIVVVELAISDFLSDITKGTPDTAVVFRQRERVITSSHPYLIPPRRALAMPTGWISGAAIAKNIPQLEVMILESETNALATVSTVQNALLGVVAIVTLMALGGIWFASRQVSQPLGALLEQIEEVQATGDLGLRVQETGALELVHLGAHLNAMLSELQHTTVSKERFQFAQQQLELAMNAGDIGLWDWNVKTGEVYYSPMMKELLGYPVDSNWRTFDEWESRLHEDDREKVIRILQEYLAHRTEEYEVTFRLRCHDGAYRWILAKGIASFDAIQQPLRVVVVHLDINDRVEYQRSLENLNHQLSHVNDQLNISNQELEQFAYVASHDLQEPLRKVSAFCKLLAEECGDHLPGDGITYLDFIVDGSQRMQTLIRDLLSFSRIKSQDSQPEQVATQDVFETARLNLSLAIQESGAEVTADALPVVWADQSQFAQLLQNLIGNGIKYCQAATPRIHVGCEKQSDRYVFSVRDNGIGIAPEFHERIFGVFKRLHNRQTYQGTGIGLAICKRIVERWGGEIWVESEEGKGSTFFFTCPEQSPPLIAEATTSLNQTPVSPQTA